MSEFKKITRVRLPFDRRDPNPGINYGIGGIETTHILQGPKGAVQFTVYWPIYLPHVERERDWSKERSFGSEHGRAPMGADVGYHSPKPMYDDQTCRDCDLLEGGKCYYDGSGLAADRWVKEVFSVRGVHPEDGIWWRLENEYRELFGEGEK
jgi:hypothetical protein